MQDDVEEDLPPTPSAAKLPTYVPLWKWKVRVLKDLEATKSVLHTPLLPDIITFEGSLIGRVPTLKLEDWDLMDNENFPHLVTESLLKQNSEGPIITLEPRKWLCGVEKARLLHL